MSEITVTANEFTAIHGHLSKVEVDEREGRITINGHGAMRKREMVMEICRRLGDMSGEMILKVYAVMRKCESAT